MTPASAIDKDSPNSEQSESINQKLQLQEMDKYCEAKKKKLEQQEKPRMRLHQDKKVEQKHGNLTTWH